MALDYASIKADNERRYGTEIGRIGRMLLADRYADRTHFIFELLQNAEDALARRAEAPESRAVNFSLSPDALRISHFGEPFDEKDMRGICGIDESTKGLTAIGRFGIGFKSVYAFTDRPEVHSSGEAFAIESYVWPTAVPPLSRKASETVFVLPLRPADRTAHAEILEGLKGLGPRTLLFLRQVEEITWSVKDGPSGVYLRSPPETISENVRRITLVGEEEGAPDVEETWLVFSREARTEDGVLAGNVEIAFSLEQAQAGGQWTVRPTEDSSLVVFFPTILPTHLGFLVQGPYRTTPSRDNVPRNDPWNQRIVQWTSELLVQALRFLRDEGRLHASTLESLPLNSAKFTEGSMFAPLFGAVCKALTSEPLLPTFDTGYVPAARAKLARTQELRELLNPSQLGCLFGAAGELSWLSGEITQGSTPELRQYLISVLHIAEVTPETVLAKLDKAVLQAQPDEWILKLYEFLNGQPAFLRQGKLDDVPLVRLEDGTHVTAKSQGQPRAFLPSRIETSFPTAKRAVCTTAEARGFLQSLGLTEPDPVDDVVWNVLPKYRADEVDVSDADYGTDIRRIQTAFTTDSKGQREKLLAALRETAFVMAVDAGNCSKRVSKPGDLYLATDRLKSLFSGVSEALLVDDAYACLRGEDVRELLEACGATRYLQTLPLKADLSSERLSEIRRDAGLERMSWQSPVEDRTVRGLQGLLQSLPQLDLQARRQKATLLWEALADLESRRGSGAFLCEYNWGYFHEKKTATLDAAFVRQLNDTRWVPDENGELQRPRFVLFSSLGWKANPFLQSKLRFKPPIIETLAKEAGIEPGVLDLLKKLGLTSLAELQQRLNIKDQPDAPAPAGPHDVVGAINTLLGGNPEPTPPVPDPLGPEPSGAGTGGGGSHGIGGGNGTGTRGGSGAGTTAGGHSGASISGSGERTPGSVGGRPFVSYVGTHPDDEEPDPDGLDHQERVSLEEKAICLILAGEPTLNRTPTNNRGFDLFEKGEDGQLVRWVEVKAMTGDLQSRPVGLSSAQFECAREHGAAYWLYVVEHAADAEAARIVRIQDPAGKARTFTFDRGWLSVAEIGDGVSTA